MARTTGGVQDILANNHQWVAAEDAEFFKRLANGQTPRYLFIGCSDSRAPAPARCLCTATLSA